MANGHRLIVFYLLFFMFVGVTLPFLPVYYQSLDIQPSRIGVLLSVGPLFSVVAPPLWGQLADRSGRPGLVLFIVSVGSLFGFGLLLVARSFEAVLACLFVFSTFAAATTTLIDSLAIEHVERNGGSFARVRTFGSLGFVIATLVFGFIVDTIDARVVVVALGLVGAYTVWAGVFLARLPPRAVTEQRPDLANIRALLGDGQLRWLLLASATHWVASAPYHGSLGLYFGQLHLEPSTLSLSAAVAVTSEVLVFATWPNWSSKVNPKSLLLAAFAVSGARWALMGLTSSPAALVALAALHGLSFGAFYVTTISLVAQRAPGALRSTGQAIFVAVTFGLGGLIGFTGSGALFDALGGARLFQLAGLLELAPLAIALIGVTRPSARPR